MRILFLIITYFIFIPVGNTADFSKYKSTCADIGFTPDTDPFADCVLELYKRDRVKVKEQVNQSREREDAERRRAEREAQEIEARQNQANYERERLRIERQRLEMERQRAEREAEAIDQANRQRYLQMIPGFVDMMNPPPAQPPATTNRTMNCESVTTNLPNSPAQIICR